ncbi:hypothetical protein SAMN05216316_2264 [Nitrosovibrio sp. Nv6]|nr:hypothetical protein SAMN05216316_2264 [Nitrosovibrio sp. Nv6]
MKSVNLAPPCVTRGWERLCHVIFPDKLSVIESD